MVFFLSVIGFTLLGFGAHLSVTSAAAIARRFGLSARLVGLTILAAGTSIPEISVALKSSLNNIPGLAVGDAIGSNITNIGLVLGVTALFIPLEVRSTTLQKEWPILFLSVLVAGLLMLDGNLSHVDGGVLIISCLLVIIWMIRQGCQKSIFQRDILGAEYQEEINRKKDSLSKLIFFLILGFILLPISAQIIVRNAVLLAEYFQVNNIIIGLTVSSLGTSLPELATSLSAARRKEYDIVIGNVLGSCIFNLLAVLSIPALIRSMPLGKHMILDYGVMSFLVILLFVFSFRFGRVSYLTRLESIILITIYVAYLVSVYFFH